MNNILFFLTPKAEVAYIDTDYTLKETLDIMEQYRYAVMPLVSHDGKYAGIITEGDLLYNIKNGALDLNNAQNIPIRSLDVRRTYSPVEIHETMDAVLKKSLSQHFVPVVDDDSTFIGIIRRKDIIEYFYKQQLNAEKNK